MANGGDGAWGLREIGQIHVPVRDLERAVEFYRDVLGMRFQFQAPEGEPTMAFFDCGGIRLMLGVPEGEGADGPASIIYYRVDDIEEVHRTLSGRDVSFRGAPHRVADLGDHELWMAFFADSEENVLALMSEVPKTG